MAYDRTETGRWAWIKSVGSSDDPLDRDWRFVDSHLLAHVWFPKHPRSLRSGDVLIYYAARHGVFPALMEVASDDVVDDLGGHPRQGVRWRWRMPVRPVVTLDLDDSPTLAEGPIAPLRLRRQSHILLSNAEHHDLRDLILQRARTATTVEGVPSPGPRAEG